MQAAESQAIGTGRSFGPAEKSLLARKTRCERCGKGVEPALEMVPRVAYATARAIVEKTDAKGDANSKVYHVCQRCQNRGTDAFDSADRSGSIRYEPLSS